jgi:hypothetical protein
MARGDSPGHRGGGVWSFSLQEWALLLTSPQTAILHEAQRLLRHIALGRAR